MDSPPFAAIFEHLTDAVIILDENERVVYGNKEYFRITQLTNAENCYHISAVADINKLPKSTIFETYLIARDNSRLSVEFSVSTVPDWPERKILIARKLETRKWRDNIHKIGYESSMDSIVVHDLEGKILLKRSTLNCINSNELIFDLNQKFSFVLIIISTNINKTEK